MLTPVLKGHVVYLAGPMGYGHNETTGTIFQTMDHLAPWRKAILERAKNNTYVVPEMVEWLGKQHDIYGSGVPYQDIELIRGCTYLVAFIRDGQQHGTFCEIAAARALAIQVVAVDIALGKTPWFVSELITDPVYPAYRQDWGKDQLERWASEELIKICGGENIDYHAYIQSPAWRQKAEQAKQQAGQRCQVCNRHRNEVTLDAHHRTYERLGSEQPDDITVLCRDCHALYEKNKRKGAPNGK